MGSWHRVLGEFLACCSGPVDTGTQSASTSGKQATTHPVWREAFHLCVSSVEQVLEVVVVHAAANGARPHPEDP